MHGNSNINYIVLNITVLQQILKKQFKAELQAHFSSAPIAALSITVPLFILFDNCETFLKKYRICMHKTIGYTLKVSIRFHVRNCWLGNNIPVNVKQVRLLFMAARNFGAETANLVRLDHVLDNRAIVVLIPTRAKISTFSETSIAASVPHGLIFKGNRFRFPQG